ncbi:sporulation membrane protein YtaF [Paenibacillus agricola]|uniref:Sporulation membrane protein YtaF n=1 Tax=Paenibacillus agricola TaxID=2716264 RepID=A0ABX0J7M6_9BACL|nr:sporulation membrane protein YtaF [Paenibacillus agricola]NHN31390.1 sporulation membrane protein YtaF [Paenibacillus agricola]
MLSIIPLMILALAVSLDGFGVGVTYGLRKIRIPLLSIGIISICSGIIIYASMQLGVWVSQFVDPLFAKAIGGAILIGIGIWALYQVLHEKADDGVPEAVTDSPKTGDHVTSGVDVASAKEVLYIELKRLGLVIQILRTPSVADMDRSGNISPYEALLLGIALSLDALGAGIGAALIGFTPWLTSMVIALASGMFLASGLHIGYKYSELLWMRRLSVFPGFVLIIMGIMKLL